MMQIRFIHCYLKRRKPDAVTTDQHLSRLTHYRHLYCHHRNRL